MTSYEECAAKIECFEQRIEKIASQEEYAEKVKRLNVSLA